MKKIIFDTSVAFKFFYHKDEKNVQKVIDIFEYVVLNNIKIIEPDIFLYELANFFIRSKKLTESEIKKNFQLLFRLNLEIINLDQDFILKISKIAKKYSLTFYDATYVTLATSTDTYLITDDREIIDTKLKQVKSIQDFDLSKI